MTGAQGATPGTGGDDVDVVLPHYRGRRFVDAAVASLVAQTHRAWHLTIVDDASEDGSLHHVRSLASSTPDRVTVLVQPENRGAAAARMRALDQTHRPLIAFLDQDDLWHPEKLERQVAHLAARPECVAVHGDVVLIDAEGAEIPGADEENERRARIAWGAPTAEIGAQLFRANCIRLISSMVRRADFAAIGGFDPDLHGGEDWEFWTRLAHHGRIDHMPLPLLRRRMHGANTVRVQSYRRCLGRLEAWEKIVRRFPHLRPLANERRRQLLRQARAAARESGKPLRARLHGLQLKAQRLGIRV